ncbi:MAG: inositol monophosphatase family protein [Pseudomonadota bacterium]
MHAADYLPLMTETARSAGGMAMDYFERTATLDIQFKGQADLLCEADETVEALIRDTLQEAHPDIAFQGEESGHHGPQDADLTWVVDPIDGTTNFLSGLPFAISIALVRNQQPIAGVIYAPVNDEMFSASQGTQSTLNNVPIQVRSQTDPARFVVGTGLPLDAYRHSNGAYGRLHKLREEVAAVRIVGTCALSLAYVASGRLDGYFEGPTGFLDCAAGVVILREAGGVVTDFWGTEEFAQNITFTAGAQACQAFLLGFTRQAPREVT